MLAIIAIYFRRVVAERPWEKIFSLEFVVAVAVSVLYHLGTLATYVGKDVKLVAFTKEVLTYSSVGLGACLTVMALAARWADADFASFLASQAPKARRIADYNTLVFKLSWTAITHWLAVVTAVLTMVLANPDVGLFQTELPQIYRIISTALVFLFTYGVMNFLATILVISIISAARAEFLVSKAGGRKTTDD